MTQLAIIQFDGDTLEATRDGARAWVVLRRACEALGIDPDSQRQKLAKSEVAVTAIITATGPDGKNYDSFCLDIDSVPHWLATINPGKIRPELRPKLIRYQRECARVLRDHFFGAPAASQSLDAEALTKAFALAMAPAFASIAEGMTRLATRIDAIEKQGATIARADASWLKQEVRDLSALYARHGMAPSKASASRRIYNAIGSAVGWTGCGRAWALLPAHLFPEARAELAAFRRAVTIVCEGEARQRQMSFSENAGGH